VALQGKSGFIWEDPFLLNDQLTEDERMIRDTAHAYAQDKLLPRGSKPISAKRPTRRSSARWANSACSG
jgi:glutaryl-CoA dehydrogenase